MIRKLLIISAVFSLFTFHSYSQIDSLKNKIEQIIKTKDATVGVSIYGIENKETVHINGEKRFPMQSVFKFHIALAVLDQVDKENLSLEQEIFISKDELLPNTWSPIRDKYPSGNVKLTLAEILKYTVAMSDNNGCDILLKMIGGPEEVENYIRSLGFKDISICFNEDEMHKDWNAQFSNWTTPKACNRLTRCFLHEKHFIKKQLRFSVKNND